MGTFQNVSKTEPCAICGKQDWCSIFCQIQSHIPVKSYMFAGAYRNPKSLAPSMENLLFIKEFKDSSALYSDVIKDKNSVFTLHHFTGCSNAGVDNSLTKPDYGITPLRNCELDPIYRSFMQLLKLSKQHQRKLLNDGWDKDMILSGKIKSLQLIKNTMNRRDFLPTRKNV